MSRLVGELILLAKSDRPDFVTPRPVDLTGLTVDTLAKARGLGDRVWTLDETASVTVPLDEQRLTQALLQLCDNAVKHTGPGDVVALGSSYDGATARLWVRDTGPGIAAEDREQIFERFGRSAVPGPRRGLRPRPLHRPRDRPRARRQLALEDEQPHGARFVITLPIPAGLNQPTPVIVTRKRPTTRSSVCGPHPDRRGRGAHRVLRLEGAGGRRPPHHRGRPTDGSGSTTP